MQRKVTDGAIAHQITIKKGNKSGEHGKRVYTVRFRDAATRASSEGDHTRGAGVGVWRFTDDGI